MPYDNGMICTQGRPWETRSLITPHSLIEIWTLEIAALRTIACRCYALPCMGGDESTKSIATGTCVQRILQQRLQQQRNQRTIWRKSNCIYTGIMCLNVKEVLDFDVSWLPWRHTSSRFTTGGAWSVCFNSLSRSFDPPKTKALID